VPQQARTVYLNQAGTSWPKPPAVVAAAAEVLRLDPAQWPAAFAAAHERIARGLGLLNADRLLLTPGGTSAISAGLAAIPFAPGERLVTSSMEHEAVAAPSRVTEAAGVPRVRVPRGPEGPFDLDALERELVEGDVRLVLVTAVSNVTGERLPIEEIIESAHEYGAQCFVDASQLVGWQSLDLRSLDADIVAFAGHKALHGLWGIGGLYVAPHLPSPDWCDVGSVSRSALAGLAAAMDWLEEPSQRGRLARANALADQLEQGLHDLPGVQIHGRHGGWRVPTVAFTVTGLLPGDIAAGLRLRGVLVSGGHQCAAETHETLGTAPDGVVRVSFGASNGPDDVTEALSALASVLADLSPSSAAAT